jgi:glc operon protein GlcG
MAVMSVKLFVLGVVAAGTLCAPGPAGSQTVRKEMDLALAKRVATAAAGEAKRLKAGGAIAVVDSGGHLVYLERLDTTFPSAAAVATEKARTAATFRRATRDFENAIRGGRHALLGVQVMTPLQGGVPIVIEGEVVGAIGVSGAMSAQQDDDIAAAAVTLLGQS